MTQIPVPLASVNQSTEGVVLDVDGTPVLTHTATEAVLRQPDGTMLHLTSVPSRLNLRVQAA